MLKIGLTVLSTLMLAVVAIEGENFLKHLAEKHQITTLDDRQIKDEVEVFKHLDRSTQLLEIKRKLMQTLGGVNDVYQELGLNSLQAKTEILGILRRVQNPPADPDQAHGVFSKVSENLNELLRFIPDDVMMQRYGHKPEPQPEWKPPPIPEWKPQPAPEWRPPPPPKPEHRPPPPAPEWQPEWQPEWRPPPPRPENHWPVINVIAEPEPVWGIVKILLHPLLDVVRLVKCLVNVLL